MEKKQSRKQKMGLGSCFQGKECLQSHSSKLCTMIGQYSIGHGIYLQRTVSSHAQAQFRNAALELQKQDRLVILSSYESV